MRYAIRTLRRSPGFTLTAILTLALGIGANTAIFSLVYAVLLKPLPFRAPAQLVTAWDTYRPAAPKVGVSPLEFQSIERLTNLFSQTAWYRIVPRDVNLVSPNAPAVQLHATFVSPALLPMLGVAPVVGRGFTAAEQPQSVLLNYRLWKGRFSGDPAIAGRTIQLDDQAFTVAGVLPPEFQFPEATDLWLPPGPWLGDELTNPVRHSLGVVARLGPGATQLQARAAIETAFHRLAAEHPKTSRGFGIRVAGMQQDLTASLRPALLLLMGAVALVLLIACANLANLMLSRAGSRTREIAIRTALGAGAGRLVRQLLVECWLLAAVGGALGLALAAALLKLSPIAAPLDFPVLLFLFAISLAAGTVFGLAPALQARKVDPMTSIRAASLPAPRTLSARGALVVLECALAVIVVVGAGILVKSFLRLVQVDPGFEARRVLTLRIAPPVEQNPQALFTRIEQRLRALSGVTDVAVANTLPLIANRADTLRFNVPGSPLIDPDALPPAQRWLVSPDYFEALGIPLRSGRWFDERDLNQPVAIVNESLARRYWPNQDASGKRFIIGPWSATPVWATIVGVAGDVKPYGLDAEAGMSLYFPSVLPRYLVVRSSAGAAPPAAAVVRELQTIDAAMPVSDIHTMDDLLAESARSRRLTTSLLGGFAALALLLALIGIYGVTAWAVSRRTREIGIRMALGADARQVQSMVVRAGLKLCGLGLALGLAAAFAMRTVIATLAFQVSIADPLVYCAAAAVIAGTATLACYLPSRRASRVDPSSAIRWE